jgi:DNA (cytosine-5)-methyltransferase 1
MLRLNGRMSLRQQRPADRPGIEGAGRVLDLFAGCGGLSLGFQTSGFEILGGVEIDPLASATHGANFHPGAAQHAVPHTVDTEPRELLRAFGQEGSIQVDILVGGPPCQAFARVGRAKLRSESERRRGHKDHRAWLQDPRAGLYAKYLDFVDKLRPTAILMENVPDVLNHGGQNVAEEVCEELERHGYDVAYTLLNAAHYGVPQMRERMFLVGYRREMRIGRITWPAPTHHHELPRGYQGTRSCALRPIRSNADAEAAAPCHYVPMESTGAGLPHAVTAEQALADLPTIHAIELARTNQIRKGARRLGVASTYDTAAGHPYANVMRKWPGFEVDEVTAHVIRFLPRDFPIFRRMRPGDQYPEAVAHARRLLEQELLSMDHPPKPGTAGYRQLEAAFVPPYDPHKFPNKWRKMEPDAPARTLMAHLGKDSYSHIHYDSRQARTISVREAARLQSFPDGFTFCGSMNAGLRQIGNAVPPLLAYALARHMRKQLGLPQRRDFRRTLGLIPESASTASR